MPIKNKRNQPDSPPKRIESLLREVEVAERTEYENRGLSVELSHLSLTFKKSDTASKMFRKFMTAYKKATEASWCSSGPADIEAYLKAISFGHRKVTAVRLLDPARSAFEEHLIELLKTTSALRPSMSLAAFAKDFSPAEITFSVCGTEKTGYTLLGETLNPRYHYKLTSLTSAPEHPHVLVFDVRMFAGAALLLNTLERIALQNPEEMKFLVAQDMMSPRFPVSYTPVPADASFRKDVLDVVRRFHLSPYEEERPNEALDNYRDIFYLTKDPDGFLTALGNSLFIKLLLSDFAAKLRNVKSKVQTDRDSLKRHSARVYENKLHVKKDILEAAETTLFKTVFGVVELDNDVSLDKFRFAEEELQRLLQKIPLLVSPDYTFRIRKLGRHKADGMHIPALKNLLVDLRTLHSFVHEDGHRIDHVLGGKIPLSEKLAFRPVLSLYQELVQGAVETLPADHAFKKNWNSTNKYNRFYYLQNTEVFARCYELHLFHNLGVRNSLLQETYTGPEYTVTPKLLHAIDLYFQEVVADIRARAEQPSAAPIPEPKQQPAETDVASNLSNSKPVRYEQISLFD